MNAHGILIVEDEKIVAFDMTVRLEALGYRVIGLADTAATALELLDRERPDLVLMDIRLKNDEDGVEVARLIRERADIPIVFVTAYIDESTLQRALLASPYGYILKPFHERELRIAIELALYKHQYEVSIRKAKEIAEETSRLKSEFLANMSHELKTPLNSIIGFTELSMDRAADPEQREYLEMSLKSAKKLVGLIDSILDFARMEAGRLQATVELFNLDEVLEESVELLAVNAHGKGLDVTYRRDAALPRFVRGDAGLILRILQALSENAVKFTERGHIGIAAVKAPSNSLPQGAGLRGDMVLRLVVEDTGRGIPSHRAETAFDRFSQLDGSPTRPAGGTGLGLAIVKKSIDLLGGTIAVESVEGQGSRFSVLVPLEAVAAPSSESEMKIPQRILLAGFSADALADARESLAFLGAELVASPSFSQAAEIAGDQDFVLADERILAAGDSQAQALGERLVICYRYSGPGRARAAEGGFRATALPLRAGLLARVFASVPSRASSSGLPADSTAAPLRKLLKPRFPDGESGIGRELLGRFLDALSGPLEAGDFGGIERAAKEYGSLFDALDGCEYGRIAFSALLLSRKGDGQGLRVLLETARNKLFEE